VLTTNAPGPPRLSFIWLEITGRCQLRCRHCYADSGPRGTHGSMVTSDWMRVIDQACDLGVSLVQFIGGEPTLQPNLGALVRHGLDRRTRVEVYTNLVRVTGTLWRLFEHEGVRLATSYYSPDAREHDSITARNSHHRTWRTSQRRFAAASHCAREWSTCCETSA
jgi:MoaA/NifB/PqqE/SkfB family radical SAM enzyme